MGSETSTSPKKIRTHTALGQLIDGTWQTGQGKEFVSFCPVDETVVWKGQAADPSQIDAAVQSARQALPQWSDPPVAERIKLIQHYAAIIDSSAGELAELISAETGKPLWESKTEVAAVVGKSALSIEALRQRRETQSFDMGDMQAVTRFKPFGVMGVLGPFNFPAHLPNGHIIPALLAGNTIVYKPSEQTPAVGQWMMEKFVQAEFPAGVVNLVQGAIDVGTRLANHTQLDGLLFTGSNVAGRSLHRAFAEHPDKMLALEMGGNNPLLIYQADDLKAAAYLTVLSAYITAGQRCTCARRLILVDDDSVGPMIDQLVDMIGRLRIGPFTDVVEPFAGTVISAAQGIRLLQAQKELIARGGRPIVEMKSLNDCDALLSPGLVDVTDVKDRSDEELFGPILGVIRVPNFDAAIAEANNTTYGLSAGLISSQRQHFDKFIRHIRAGIVNWNRQTTGASGRMPFGGCGLSGNNRPSAFYAADYCSFPVASLEAAGLSLPDTPMQGIEL